MQNQVSKIKITTEFIDAKKAHQYLLLNVENNRKPRTGSLVKQYAADMVADNWKLTGESIKFNTNGKLFDGQNRLLAVIDADKIRPGIAVEFTVVRDVEPAAMMVVDSGGVRRPADALKIAGVNKYETQKAALAKRILVFEGGSRSVLKSAGKSAFDPGQTITKTRIVEYVIRFESHIEHCSALGISFYDASLVKKMMTPTDWAFCYWLFEKTDPDGAKFFLGRLASLEDVPNPSPIRQLFNKLQNPMKPVEKLEHMVAGFDAYCRGKQRYNVTPGTTDINLFTQSKSGK